MSLSSRVQRPNLFILVETVWSVEKVWALGTDTTLGCGVGSTMPIHGLVLVGHPIKFASTFNGSFV